VSYVLQNIGGTFEKKKGCKMEWPYTYA